MCFLRARQNLCLSACMHVCMYVCAVWCVRAHIYICGRDKRGERETVCVLDFDFLLGSASSLHCSLCLHCSWFSIYFGHIFFSFLYLIRASVNGDSALFVLLVVLTLF